MKTTSRLLTTLLLFLSVSLAAPNARAVVPAPDGGYPGFNTAEGQKALFNLSTGAGNTAIGWFSLFSNAGGSFNTATGAGALLFNTADENTALGTVALFSNTTGNANTANGYQALFHNSPASTIQPSVVMRSVITPAHRQRRLGLWSGQWRHHGKWRYFYRHQWR